MKAKYVIYISAAFVLAYLVLKNPTGYQAALNKFTDWFGRTFSAFGRVAK
jgi:hypothetical protein